MKRSEEGKRDIGRERERDIGREPVDGCSLERGDPTTFSTDEEQLATDERHGGERQTHAPR